MLLDDLLRTAFRQVYRNKRRYKAAIIGTAVGIAGLITVVTMGDSVESTLGRNLEILGNATIVKAEWDYYNTPRWHHGHYSADDVEYLKRLPDVLTVAAAEWKGKVRVSFQKKTFRFGLGGVEASFFDTVAMTVDQGRRLSKEDEARKRHVCVIGQTIRKELFDGNNPLGQRILVDGLAFEVVGVLGGAEDPSYMETVFVPLTVAQAQIEGMRKLHNIYVRAKDWDTVPALHMKVRRQLANRQPGYSQSMSVVYDKDRIAAIQTIVLIFKFFLLAAIGVTLILGGLGITNVMLAVVNERTTEIGLRKAVGATEGMIVFQFLFESLTVSLIGAVAGILCGLWAVGILQSLFETTAGYATFFYSVFGSVFISVVLGVASGLLPAARAGRLTAVEAMKFE
ncbi:MAG: ABC transporter permease [Desulfomonile tiedjei]|nr:ABC transporter permease [Desulfomonile tiedjei]